MTDRPTKRLTRVYMENHKFKTPPSGYPAPRRLTLYPVSLPGYRDQTDHPTDQRLSKTINLNPPPSTYPLPRRLTRISSGFMDFRQFRRVFPSVLP